MCVCACVWVNVCKCAYMNHRLTWKIHLSHSYYFLWNCFCVKFKLINKEITKLMPFERKKNFENEVNERKKKIQTILNQFSRTINYKRKVYFGYHHFDLLVIFAFVICQTIFDFESNANLIQSILWRGRIGSKSKTKIRSSYVHCVLLIKLMLDSERMGGSKKTLIESNLIESNWNV